MSSVASEEVAKFGRLAPQWWDPKGPMRPLHQMNPLRVGWIDQHIATRLGAPVRLLDLGCGAGIAAEALARRGHIVLGVDASPEAIGAAEAHADGEGLELTYRVGTPEALAGEGQMFQAVNALEVIEHVEDQAGFMCLLASLVTPGGLLFMSTVNRTVRSLAMAKIGAEYVARLLPVGTHDWRKFVPPEALAGYARAAGLRMIDLTGMEMAPLSGNWKPTRNVSVNYLAAFQK